MTQRYALQKTPLKRVGFRLPSDLTQHLNPDQLKVVTAPDGPVLVLAGPGSGKTRTLTYRVAYLLAQGVEPEHLLLMTFTVKAAQEMMGRVEQILRFRPEGIWGGTFHHIGNLILRQHAPLLGRTSTFGILDEEDAKDLIAACLSERSYAYTDCRLPRAPVLENLFSLSANTQRPLAQVVQERYPQFAPYLDFIEGVATAYRLRKCKANLMDYDDLLTEWLRLFQEHPHLARQYGAQFHYILVDEYQDTNRLQFEILKTLTLVHRNLMVVGDDAQSIYGFRGADIRNLLQFPTVFQDATIHRLEINYRSTPQILRLANASIRNNARQFPKDLKAVCPDGPLPVRIALADAKQQACFVAQRVLELREEGIRLQEMAVLFRARFQSAELELELARRNIPYVVRGGIRFFEQAHIKDVLAYLKIAINPKDELAWRRALHLQEGIGPASIQKIWDKIASHPDPLQAACRLDPSGILSKRSLPAWNRLKNTLNALHAASILPHNPADLILLVLRSGYEAALLSRFEDASDRKEDLEQLAHLASQYESVERFVEDITLRESFKGESLGGWQEPDEYLVLSTIHQAKGLEWRVVFLIGLTEGQFPHPKSVEDPWLLEEERRLFYVAVTRTKKELYLTYPLMRYSYDGGAVLLRPSLFLEELDDELIEEWQVDVAQS